MISEVFQGCSCYFLEGSRIFQGVLGVFQGISERSIGVPGVPGHPRSIPGDIRKLQKGQ